jgi:putative membrane protein
MFIIRWIILAVVFLGLAHFIPGIKVVDFWSGFWAAIALSLVNTFIRPILLLLTLPVNVLTLGFFTLIINALMILLVSAVIPGFFITGFWWAVVVAVVVSVVNMLLSTK